MKIKRSQYIKDLQKIEAQEKALKEIANIIADRREDEHGNSETRSDYIDRVITETKKVLASVGIEKRPDMPGWRGGDVIEISIPEFVK